MDYAALAQLILGVITEAPPLIARAMTVYNADKSNFSETDQARIDAAYQASIASDQAKTDAATTALDEAAKH